MPEAVVAPLQQLAAALRARGVRAGVGELLAAHRALAAVDAGSREQAFYALRATLCSGHADQLRFAAAFAEVFGRAAAAGREDDPFAALGGLALPRVAPPGGDGRPEPAALELVPAAWSDDELLRTKDFAAYTAAERAAARRLLARLAARADARQPPHATAAPAWAPAGPARDHARVARPRR